MFFRTLTTFLGIICLITFSFADDKFSSFRELKKIPDGMSSIHESGNKLGIIAIHGFYPAYWIGIHHEWVKPFNYLIENDINTFFYKYDWNDCPSNVSMDFNRQLKDLIVNNPEIEKWQIVGHSMGGTVVLFSILNAELNEDITYNIVATALHMDINKVPMTTRLSIEQRFKKCPDNLNSFDDAFENGFKNKLVQWRNIKEFDSQFKKYDFDPYEKDIKNSMIIQFPDSLNGERVGHTSSLYFAILEIVN
jgi:hypothetical protein